MAAWLKERVSVWHVCSCLLSLLVVIVIVRVVIVIVRVLIVIVRVVTVIVRVVTAVAYVVTVIARCHRRLTTATPLTVTTPHHPLPSSHPHITNPSH